MLHPQSSAIALRVRLPNTPESVALSRPRPAGENLNVTIYEQ